MKRMKTYGQKVLLIGLVAWLVVLVVPASTSPAPQNRKIDLPLRFDRYYPLEDLYDALRALNAAYPKLTTLEEVGRSDEGRPLFALTLNNPATGRAIEKPAIYIDANIHGNEIQGGEICLYLLQYLLSNYGQNEEITSLVDRTCFYVVPVVNPDGRHHFITDANTASSNRGLRIPVDDDRDGLFDEDFPDDLDRDGNICQMRKRDPFGAYKTDPEDSRLLIRVKPGEKGEWTILGEEGIDNDGDGRINEDAEGYVDPNRNWGFDWAPPYVQNGAGEYPFSGTGIKSLAQWIYARPNICIGWSFHNFGGMYLRGPSRKGLGEFPPQDVAVYDYIGKQGEKIMPGYRYLVSWRDLYPTYGDSVEWLSQIMGAYGYVAEVYQLQSEVFRKPGEKPDVAAEEAEGMMSMLGEGVSDRERLKFNDHLAQGELHKPWQAFKHPVYGDIEIGGWVKMSSRLPAAFMIEDMVHRNAMAVLFSAKHVPEVSLEVSEVKSLGSGLYRLRTRLTNSRAIPTMSALAEKNNLYTKDVLRVSGKGIKILAGGLLTDPYRDAVNFKMHKPELQFLIVPGFGKIEHQFIVEGSGEVRVEYESRHAGKLAKALKLK